MKKIFDMFLNFFKKLFNREENANNDNDDIITIISGNSEEQETEESNIIQENEENNIVMEESKYNGTVILLDNGHAKSTPGKRSPLFEDGKTQFFEYEFNRDIVRRISEKLDKLGIKYKIITPEVEEDIRLSVRANRANEYCDLFGRNKCLLISVHANAAKGEWTSARGWSIYTTKGVTKSDAIATMFFEEAEKLLPGYKMTLRKDMQDGDPDYEENFTIIYASKCPAVLTENLFMNNKIDVQFLMSEEGRNVIADIHINAIKRVCGLA